MVSSGDSTAMIENAKATTEGKIKMAYSTYVIDSDTFDTRANERVRLEGIDAQRETPLWR